jgi:uncharacterized protein (DUF2132 family)
VKFAGDSYVHSRDAMRLTAQLVRLWNLMSDSAWRSLEEISSLTGAPPASASAQLRHLRKTRFGAHKVEKLYVQRGLYLYRLVPSPTGAKPWTQSKNNMTNEKGFNYVNRSKQCD